ncbi:tyrosine-type recombinase/integrase [Lysinibacillus sp. NPDC093688]|uniref:tyrosine-type recombinase/integrase n=1 Tax=Lysinibacillus sp. NPDC093688 TaxID=3390577 RepID=UPI003D059276
MKYWVLEKELSNSENTEIVNLFLLSLKKKNRSKQTIIRQRNILKLFFRKKKKPYNFITSNDIQHWLTEQQTGRKEITIRNYLAILRAFYYFCATEKFIEVSPLQDNEKSLSCPERYWELKLTLPNQENQYVINKFLVNLKNLERSKRTIICKRIFLQHFFKDFDKSFSFITLEEIEKWLIKNGDIWSDKTISAILSALRTFYDFCWEEGTIENPPLRNKRKVRNYSEKDSIIQIRLPNTENQKVINEYLLNLKERNKSHRTIEEYRFILQAYFRATNIHFSLLKNNDFQQWIQIYKKRAKETTVGNYMSIFRSFYAFCVRKDYLEKSPITYKREKGKDNKYWEISNSFANNENRVIINEYLLSMKLENLSSGTIYQYRFFLNKFFKDKCENCFSLTSEEIREWFIPHQKGLEEGTIKKRLIVLSSFYKFCVDEGYMMKSPIKTRWFPRLPKSVPKYLEKGEIAKIRQICEKQKGLRNRVIVELLLTSGCRISEVNMLNKSDIDLENRIAHVLGKGKKIREVHFSEKCAILLERLLESYEIEHPALFVSEWGTRLSVRRMQQIVEEIGKEAEIEKPLYPHRLRHTFATELLTKGADLSFIADELGHKQLQTTKIYACLPNWKLINLYRKFKG